MLGLLEETSGENLGTHAPTRTRGSVPVAWLALALTGLLTAIYYRTAVTLWTIWTTNDNYSHGPLVPLVSLALAWSNRARLRAIPVAPDARGLVWVAAACALQILGIRADVFALQGYSIVVMVLGLALTFLGGPLTRALAFPIAFLSFMLTFPPLLMNRLSFALKEITFWLSTHAAESLGVTLERNGMSIRLASGELRIENPCSGLRSLLALIATGALFAHLQPGGRWRRVVVLLASVPIAMIANVVRITLLVVVGHYAGVAQATGAFHDLTGYLLYAVALAGLLAVRAALTPRSRAVRTAS